MKIHVVQKGDTLWEIAKKYGVDFEEIKQLNSQLSSPDMIMPGMKIKIPSSSKAVQKENMKMKEMKQPVQTPYKEIPSKPIPVIKEDDKEKPKPVKPHMPMQPAPQPAPQPMQPVPQPIQPILQMPIMDHDVENYTTTINFPQMPYYPEPKKEPAKKKKQKPMPMEQPMVMIPMCCHVVHPCWPHAPHHHFPVMGAVSPGHMPSHMPQNSMEYPYHHDGMMESPTMEMPVKPSYASGKNDCGCKGKKPFPSYPEYSMKQPNWDYPTEQKSIPGHYPPNPAHAYPPQFANNQGFHAFPTPPGFPPFTEYDFRDDEDESSSD